MKEIKICVVLLILSLSLITGSLVSISGLVKEDVLKLVFGVVLTLLSIRSFRIFKT